jgi:hypothetical protein
MKDPHREFCRRQHRMLAHYLAIQAWTVRAGEKGGHFRRNKWEPVLEQA